MPRKKDPITSGEVYLYNGEKITISPFFIYEVDLYRMAKMRANIISTKYYKSNKLLKVKDIEVIRRFRLFTIERHITLLSAPREFIEENDLLLYIPKPKRKRNETTKTSKKNSNS